LTGEAATALAARVATEFVRRCELRPKIKVVAPGTLPKSEFKARRVIDRRRVL
jgi:phenylacetate-coenzyme A ligase PaaK-like adenylate-forming protein